MAYYSYEGDPLREGEGPQSVTAFGVRFQRGEPIKVDDPTISGKLDGNGHFKKVDGRRKSNGDVHKD